LTLNHDSRSTSKPFPNQTFEPDISEPNIWGTVEIRINHFYSQFLHRASQAQDTDGCQLQPRSTEPQNESTKNMEGVTWIWEANRRGRSREGGGRLRTGHPIQHCSCGSHSAGILNPILAGRRPSRTFNISAPLSSKPWNRPPQLICRWAGARLLRAPAGHFYISRPECLAPRRCRCAWAGWAFSAAPQPQALFSFKKF
jgi:hypothetical protein